MGTFSNIEGDWSFSHAVGPFSGAVGLFSHAVRLRRCPGRSLRSVPPRLLRAVVLASLDFQRLLRLASENVSNSNTNPYGSLAVGINW